MSYCQQLGKDRVIFVTKEDHEKPSTVELSSEESGEEGRGLILADGSINWNCPCLGGMASGPCGYQFREAFGCFHYSSAESKGSDCIEKFAQMQECMNQFPNLYPNRDEDEEPSDEPIGHQTEPTDQQLSSDKAMQRLSPQSEDKQTNGENSVEKHTNRTNT